ncbi:rho guanine nucleotide exchange factor 37 [Spea bombifrons]|uniref:rho guanine nucleotide exchange factor 37 n=1 Tax=Spea bombifrons TaxID=233779 RepID=UPI00234A013F|nr:rho guanine nucleotide exchange factor 37 [Spea bombifrons]XP_053319332.1 rho guanine nucleotide exchange factor 37 [Spea bombifrons]
MSDSRAISLTQDDVPLLCLTNDQYKKLHGSVAELIKSEEMFVQSLQFLICNIQIKLNKVPEVDVRSLFSNIEDIFALASSFLEGLQEAVKDEQNHLTRIGYLFQEFSRDMENAYGQYCWAYQRTLSLLDHYKETHVAEKIQQVLLSESSSSHSYPDISYYLIYPVQRITKYPLLVQQMLEINSLSTEAHDSLQRALHIMEAVNANINEKKRHKEIASKYVHENQRSLLEKMSQLNTHTLSKKTQRLSQMLKHHAGIVPKREDKEFDGLAEMFQDLASGVSQLEQNVFSYVKSLEEFLCRKPNSSCLEELPQSALNKPSFLKELYENIYPVFKRRLQCLVLQPLSNLSECLKGPKNLIKKRMDKLLDYENLEEKYSETGKMTLQEEEIMNTYKGIHAMLLNELPSCISLSKQWVHQLLLNFIALQVEVTKQCLHAAAAEAFQMDHSRVPEAAFKQWVEDSIRHSMSQLTDLTKKFEEIPPPPIQDNNPAMERRVQQLLDRYEAEKLYQVTQNVSGSRNMDLTAQRGDVVAVLQVSDTKGNKNRWLVDAGGSRGYLPCNKLQPYQTTHAQVFSLNSHSPKTTVENRRQSYAAPECPYPIYAEAPYTAQVFQDIALYAFSARSSYEVSLIEGEPVTVLEPHDKKGSKEWSLVEVRGQRGYVPSNYISKVPVLSRSLYVPSSYM